MGAAIYYAAKLVEVINIPIHRILRSVEVNSEIASTRHDSESLLSVVDIYHVASSDTKNEARRCHDSILVPTQRVNQHFLDDRLA